MGDKKWFLGISYEGHGVEKSDIFSFYLRSIDDEDKATCDIA